MKKVLPIILIFIAAAPASAQLFRGRFFGGGQCGPGGCRVQSAPVFVMPRPEPIPEPAPAPEPEPESPIVGDPEPKDPMENYGLDWSKIHLGGASINGREISVEEASDIISGKIPDDSKKLRLVIIGTPDQRKPVTDAFFKLEQSLRDRIVVWSVPADHWSLKDQVSGDFVFKADGKPTVYLQCPDGKCLHRQDDFGGVGDLEAIRKAVKAYDSKKDPDLRKDQPAQPLSIHPAVVGATIGAGLVYVASKKAQKEQQWHLHQK